MVVLDDVVVFRFHRSFVDVQGLFVDVELCGGVGDFFDFFLELVDPLNLQIAHLPHINHPIMPRLDPINIPPLNFGHIAILIRRVIQALNYFQLIMVMRFLFRQVVLVEMKRLIYLTYTVILHIL